MLHNAVSDNLYQILTIRKNMVHCNGSVDNLEDNALDMVVKCILIFLVNMAVSNYPVGNV